VSKSFSALGSKTTQDTMSLLKRYLSNCDGNVDDEHVMINIFIYVIDMLWYVWYVYLQ